jgi:hypothetical protein
MKKLTLSLIALFFSITFFAQGIAVQGIARDNTNAAILNTNLNFDFRILDAADAVLFRETQQIRTDNFGLFSHVVSTGTAQGGTNFNNIDFSLQGLKLIVWIEYQGNNVQVYNQELQYVPYAHYAKKAANATNADNATNATNADNAIKANNGVPPGTVVAFLGDDSKIPAGWVKAVGQDISSGAQYAALRAVIGNTIPDLRARFLRGQGTSSNIDIRIYDETTTVGQYLNQTIAGHVHYIDITRNTNATGGHRHRITRLPMDGQGGGRGNIPTLYNTSSDDEAWGTPPGDGNNYHTNTEGNHSHSVRVWGDTQDVKTIQNGGVNLASRGEENRPWTVVVNYIIKL